MDFGHGKSGSADEVSPNARNAAEKPHLRHSPEQVQHLEEYFKGCPNPTEDQRVQLGRILGLAPSQIRFWFQNKRNQMKIQNDKASNNALKEDNARMILENEVMREMLRNPLCAKCDGRSAFDDQVRQQNVEKLRIENALLKQEYRRLANIVAVLPGRPKV